MVESVTFRSTSSAPNGVSPALERLLEASDHALAGLDTASVALIDANKLFKAQLVALDLVGGEIDPEDPAASRAQLVERLEENRRDLSTAIADGAAANRRAVERQFDMLARERLARFDARAAAIAEARSRCGLAVAEVAWAAGNGAFDSLLRAICGFRCASLEDLRAKSDHLFALRAELDEGMIALLLEADGRRVEERSDVGPDRQAAQSPAPFDPIYALLDGHRIALAALDAAVGRTDGDEIARARAHEADLHRRLFATCPWTLAGAAAFASYVAAMPRLEQFDEPEFSAAPAMATLAAALSAIAGPAAKVA